MHVDLNDGYQYYYNVLVKCIGLRPEHWREFYPDLEEIWDTQDLTSATPQVLWAYPDGNIEEDYDWEIYSVPHAVVAIGEDNTIIFYESEL